MTRSTHGARLASVSAAASSLVVLVLSCVDLDSLGSGGQRPTTPDASEPSIPDPCLHAAPPGPPSKSDEGPDLPQFELALTSADITSDAGFDLDGVCTCDTRPGAARGGASSCLRPDAARDDCDGPEGADNVIARVQEERLAGRNLATIVNATVAAGRRNLLLTISKYNGLANDTDVAVGAIFSLGIREQGCPTSQLTDAGTWTPGNCGEDKWAVLQNSAVVTGSGSAIAATMGNGWVRDFQLVVTFEGKDVLLPFNEEREFFMSSPVLTGKIVPLDTKLAPRDPTRPPTDPEKRLFRLENGVIAGRLGAASLLELLGTVQIAGSSFCNTEIFLSARDDVCASQDVTRAVAAPAAAPCDALSAAAVFAAGPARSGAALPPPPSSTKCDAKRDLMRCP